MRFTKPLLVTLLTCVATAAMAQVQCPEIRGNVVVFGGRGSTTPEMQQCYPDFLAVSNTEGEQYVRCLAKQIDQSDSTEKIVIAGHSSGAAQAERLAHAVKDKSKIRLVLLEGFGSPKNQRGVETTCWFAYNGRIQGMNASYMKNPADCTGTVRSFEAPWCNNPLCLHLSLVNRNADADLNKANVFTKGLKQCDGNLDWLELN